MHQAARHILVATIFCAGLAANALHAADVHSFKIEVKAGAQTVGEKVKDTFK